MSIVKYFILQGHPPIPLNPEKIMELILLLLFVGYLSKRLLGTNVFSIFFQGIGNFLSESISALFKGLAGITAMLLEKGLHFIKIVLEFALEGLGQVLEWIFEKIGDFCTWLWDKMLDLFS